MIASGYAAPREEETRLDTVEAVDALIANAQPDPDLPERVDLHAHLPEGMRWPVRDQRHRGTCTAFAVTAGCEMLMAARTGEMLRLSPEYLYWRSREVAEGDLSDRPPQLAAGAVRLSDVRQAFERHGIARDDLMPYDMTDALYTERPPTPEADADAATRLFNGTGYDYGYKDEEPHGAADAVRRALKDGQPVALGLETFRMMADRDGGLSSCSNWQYAGARNSGLIPGPRMQSMGVSTTVHSGHVVLVTGYVPGPEELGGSWFIFRNSWSCAFGRYPAAARARWPGLPGQGYGAVSAAYVEAFTIEYLALSERETVPIA